MPPQSKPFDLLIIVDPAEYQYNLPEAEQGLQEISDICRTHKIPVRMSRLSDDGLIRKYFEGCDYARYSEIDDIPSSFGSPEEVRVMLTGGNFTYDYILPGELEKARLQKDQAANYNPQEPSREFAVTCGCVSYIASELHKKITAKGKKPTIFIDPKSIASSESSWDKNAIYTLHYVGTRSEVVGSVFVVVKKIQRESVFAPTPV